MTEEELIDYIATTDSYEWDAKWIVTSFESRFPDLLSNEARYLLFHFIIDTLNTRHEPEGKEVSNRLSKCVACGSFRTENGEDIAIRVSKLEAENERLQNIVQIYKAALEKYANPETHSMDKDGFVWGGDYFDYETARAALEGK